MFECPSDLSVQVPECPPSARVPECSPSARVNECPTSTLVLKCPLDAQVPKCSPSAVWVASECPSTLRVPLMFECPLSVLKVALVQRFFSFCVCGICFGVEKNVAKYSFVNNTL